MIPAWLVLPLLIVVATMIYKLVRLIDDHD